MSVAVEEGEGEADKPEHHEEKDHKLTDAKLAVPQAHDRESGKPDYPNMGDEGDAVAEHGPQVREGIKHEGSKGEESQVNKHKCYYYAMLVADLYKQYHIMPQLAQHQLRVGAVGQIVAENWSFDPAQDKRVDAMLTTKLCLLHDMGNIVKFDLSEEAVQTKMFGQKVDLPYWRRIQQEYRDMYGKDAHAATKGILAEAGLEWLNPLIDEEGNLYKQQVGEEQLAKADPAAAILMYADMRVVPRGVASYQARVDDLWARGYGRGMSEGYLAWAKEFDQWVHKMCKIDPETITEAMARVRWDELLSVTI